ncbi:hypothetical protein [Mucilaginibacter aquaedulcis]|uniref:hypothetical protein n=1 Tax=Mucilaginibacter aquaedulcis TaxID=1187081 RepID=UPI0025B5E519|nr:hypothetical protein [Mucilaginibacter aquaedulcis]MDN3548849.1 hypothetical protein [Mucilaginibacter aquaedulcis]
MEVNINRVTRRIESTFDSFTSRFEKAADHFLESVSPETELERLARENGEDRVGRIKLTLVQHASTGLRFKLYSMQIKIRDATDGPVLPALKSLKDPGAALYAPMDFLIYESEQQEVILEYIQPSVFFDTFVDESGETGRTFDRRFQSLIDFADLSLN